MTERPTTEAPQVRYELAAPKVARIVLDRAEKRNAQGQAMTYQLDAAMRRACHDDDITVIILAAAGDHFSAGHDVSGQRVAPPTSAERVSLWGEFGGPGWESGYSYEKEVFLEMTERWRNAPKPVIAEVQGSVISGGLMLMWMCDIIVCSDDARFRDNTGSDMGVPGVEFFNHPYELGVRRAKEFLFTGGWLSAADALACGMVNRVVPRAQLSANALDLAVTIARTDRFALKLMKESVNNAQDQMGRRQAMRTSFANHQIGHQHNMLQYGYPIDISRLPDSVRLKLEQALKARRPQQQADGTTAPGKIA
ncbi:MAG: enoyl-CoA hydratase [Rhodospirillaceae bacterium]|nr:MAG: enoyl-CoA hydratase [Rhodospirillaceae bacterium]